MIVYTTLIAKSLCGQRCVFTSPTNSPLYSQTAYSLHQTQDRMLKSAENFLAGFFGLEWYQDPAFQARWSI